jgi:predicted HTH transcriptional regulator
VYDSPAVAPRTTDIEADAIGSFIESVSATAYQAARDLGGDIPYTAIREVAENLIHADFRDPVVSVMDGGRTIRFADRGPGIPDKKRAALPGFTTASGPMKEYIRGVGSGLPIVSEYLAHHEGALEIDDNIAGGTVVTLRAAGAPRAEPVSSGRPLERLPGVDIGPDTRGDDVPHVSTRQKRVLSLVLEVGSVGPTLVSNELGVGLSTAHRDLAYLEKHGLIVSGEGGKRVLTDAGKSYLDALFG